MTRVLIIGASGGIGAALLASHRAAGHEVQGCSRRDDGLELTDPDSIRAVLGRQKGPFQRVVIATGALEINGVPPEKTIKAIARDAMLDHFAVNTVGPALILGQIADLMDKKQPAVVAVLSARVGSVGDNRLGGWVSYRAAKAALNQVVHTAAIELARSHPQLACVALHPGTVETAFTAKYLGRHPAVPAAQAARNLQAVMDGLRPADTGRFLDWAGKEVPW